MVSEYVIDLKESIGSDLFHPLIQVNFTFLFYPNFIKPIQLLYIIWVEVDITIDWFIFIFYYY